MFRFVRLMITFLIACGAVISTQAAPSDADVAALRAQVETLQAQVRSLEAQVRALQARFAPAPASAPAGLPASVPAASGGAAAPAAIAAATSATYENEAQAVINDIVRLTDQGDADGARAKIAELRARYGASKVAGQGTYFANEIEVIGKNAPADWGIEKWFQGKDQIDLSAKPATLVVFWEEWCPHCKDEMPKLQQLYAAHKAQGFQILGVTKVTETATDEKVQAYLEKNRIEFPVGKESGTSSTYFNVKGIPAAAILKGGKIVWRGHPIRLTDEILKRWL